MRKVFSLLLAMVLLIAFSLNIGCYRNREYYGNGHYYTIVPPPRHYAPKRGHPKQQIHRFAPHQQKDKRHKGSKRHRKNR